MINRRDQFNRKNKFNIGDFSEKIKIFRTKLDTDENDLPIESKELLRNCFAAVVCYYGKEFFEMDTTSNMSRRKFIIRNSKTEVNIDDIVEYNKNIYNIKFINPLVEGTFLELMCEAIEK